MRDIRQETLNAATDASLSFLADGEAEPCPCCAGDASSPAGFRCSCSFYDRIQASDLKPVVFAAK